jgi:hypothetical protein
MAARPKTAHRLLTRHFLRCFLENDLIAPDADRAQLVAVTGATLLSSTIFITVVMACFKYVVGRHTPGQLAVAALDDRFFYIALSMVVLGLLAAAQWDALVVDARDTAILEPLPVRTGTIRRAKLAAVAVMGLGAAAALNAVPSVVFPLLMLINQKIGIGSGLALVAAQALVTLAAGAFAYLAVIAFRETLAAILGPRWFHRVSPWAQGAVIVALGSALLLMPPASVRVERGLAAASLNSPPLWFLGAHEVVAGGILAEAPRGHLTRRQLAGDRPATAAYRRHQARFRALAARAVLGFSGVGMLAAAAYSWNARRRLPVLAPARLSDRARRWPRVRAFASSLAAGDAAARAGYFFALAAMWRSPTHRLTLACAAAVGVAMSVVAVAGVDLQRAATLGTAPTRLLAIQPLILGALLVGFRHVIRVPAELRASWGIQLAWQNKERQFMAGVRRAALAGLIVPVLAALLPLFAYVLGSRLALAHAALGLAAAIVVLETLLLGYTKVPFACTYVPSENLKALAPIYLLVFLIGAFSFAGMEGAALASPAAAARVLLFLAVGLAAVRLRARARPLSGVVDFNEAPASIQRLGLHT